MSQIEENQNNPVQEYMQSGFFTVIDHIFNAKSEEEGVSRFRLILFYADSITRIHGVMAMADNEKGNYTVVVVALMETVGMVTTQYMSGLAELYMFQTQEK